MKIMMIIALSSALLFAGDPQQNENRSRLAAEALADDEKVKAQLESLIVDLKRYIAKRDEMEGLQRKKLLELAEEIRQQYRLNAEEIQRLENSLQYDFKFIGAWHHAAELKEQQHLLTLYWSELGNYLPKKSTPDKELLERVRSHHDDFRDFPRIHERVKTLRLQIVEPVALEGDYPFSKPLVTEEFSTAKNSDVRTFDQWFRQNGSRSTIETQFEPNLFSENKDELCRFLALRWSLDELILDRTAWAQSRISSSPIQVQQNVERRISDHELEGDLLKKQGRWQRFDESSAIAQQFEMAAEKIVPGPQVARSGSNGSRCRRNEMLEMQVRYGDDRFHFEMNEFSTNNGLQLVSGKAGLKITVDLTNLFFHLVQTDLGKVRIVYDESGVVNSQSATSFAELYRNQPDFVERVVFPILRHHGFATPLDRFDASVVWTLVKKLEAKSLGKNLNSLAIVEQLDNDSFEVRNRASKQIDENFYLFSEAIEKELRRSRIPFNYKSEMELLVRGHRNRHAEHEELIKLLGLEDDIGYLLQLTQILKDHDQSVIFNEVRNLTKQDFGTNTDDWRRWFDAQIRMKLPSEPSSRP